MYRFGSQLKVKVELKTNSYSYQKVDLSENRNTSEGIMYSIHVSELIIYFVQHFFVDFMFGLKHEFKCQHIPG